MEDGLVLNPDFQRGHVWTQEQQQSFVESFLRGGRSGRHIYFNFPSRKVTVPKDAYNDYVCVDGLQRITALLGFVNNEFQAFGAYYKDFENLYGYQFTLRVNTNDLKSKADVLRWYLEMNTGGTPHSTQEIERVTEMYSQEIEKEKNHDE